MPNRKRANSGSRRANPTGSAKKFSNPIDRISVDPDEYLVSDVVKRIGDDNLLISTDYPHIDSHFPHALDEFFELEGLSDDSRDKILWDNCAKLYEVS